MVLNLSLDILSNFEGDGFQKADSAISGIQNASEDLGLSTKEINKRMDAMNLQFNETAQQFETTEGQALDTSNALQVLASDHAALGAMAETTGYDLDIIENRLAATETELAKNSEGATVFRNEFTGAMDESALAASKVSNQLDTFNQEALSALFAALAVGQQMSQLTEPAFEAAGVFELVTDTLKIFFLPVALMVRDFVLKLRDALLSLPPGVRKVVGVLVLIIAIIAKVGVVLAGLALNMGGIQTIVLALGGAFTTAAGMISSAATAMGSAIYTALGPIGIIIGLIIAAVIAFKLAWDRNLGGIRQKVGRFVKFIGNNLPNVVRAVMPVVGVLDLLIMAVNRLFGKDIDTLGEKFEGIGDKVANMGDNMIESGEKFDEMNKKAPDTEKMKNKFKPNMNGSKLTSRGSDTVSSSSGQTQINNKYNIETKEGQDEKQIAREISKIQKRNKDMKTRET